MTNFEALETLNDNEVQLDLFVQVMESEANRLCIKPVPGQIVAELLPHAKQREYAKLFAMAPRMLESLKNLRSAWVSTSDPYKVKQARAWDEANRLLLELEDLSTVPEPSEVSDGVDPYHLKEQIALFASHSPAVPSNHTGGQAEWLNDLIEQAEKFCEHYASETWEERDWYLTSDAWLEAWLKENGYAEKGECRHEW